MIQFLLPGFLIGMVGLAIPIGIHLWNTRDSRVIKVGSIRWLRQSDSVKVSRVKINEVPLLMLRLLIILLLVFILADTRSPLVLKENNSAKWILVDHGIIGAPEITDQISALEELGWEPRWLHPSFAPMNEVIELDVNQNHWQVLSLLDNSELSPDSIIVLSASQNRNFEGVRPELTTSVQWISIPSVPSNGEPILGLDRGDSIFAYFANYEGSNLIPQRAIAGFEVIEDNGKKYFHASSEPVNRRKITIVDSIFVNVIGDGQGLEVRNIISALNAINSLSFEHLVVNSVHEPNFIIDLSGEFVPSGSQVMISLQLEEQANSMIVRQPDYFNKYYLTKPVSIENMMKYDFLQSMYALLTSDYYNQLRARSSFELPVNAVNTRVKNELKGKPKSIMADLSPVIWLILVLLVGAERAISNFRKQ